MIGVSIGNYQVTGKLGEGGMGSVWAAEHRTIGRKAAIKVLLPEMSANPAIVQRFFNEARATSMIRHPGIVDIFDFGQLPDGRAYLAMELLDGESLAARLQRSGPLALAEIAAIGRQAASALAAAHEKGIVHRDLKPDNIHLVPDADGVGGVRVKILDFGIAKLVGGGDISMKTSTGAIMGTPVYMSPEQCRGAGEVDFRSDIYSLGCVLYELSCGQPPFLRAGFGEIIAAHMYVAPPSPSSLAPSVTPALESLLLRLLAKEPGDRPASMEALRRELEVVAGIRPSDRHSAVRQAGTNAPTLLPAATLPPSTTLGGAASEVSLHLTGGATLPESPRRRPLARIMGAVIAVAALGTVALTQALRSPSTPPGHRPPGGIPASVVAPVAPPKVAPSPATVALRVESDPPGAEVFDAETGKLLGETPFIYEAPRRAGEVAFKLRLGGYEEARLALDGQSDGSARATLHPLAATHKTSSASHPHAAPSPKPHAPEHNKKAGDVGLFDD